MTTAACQPSQVHHNERPPLFTTRCPWRTASHGSSTPAEKCFHSIAR